MKEKLLVFIKKETVLTAAAALAFLSAFFVAPDAQYLDYIDWQVLGILLALMTVMAGVQKNGIFDEVGRRLLNRTKNTAQLTGTLVFLCFFSSMLITNDVALITFVPFAMLTLRKCGQERLMVLVIVLQTIAANLGSMFTPIGNPQNLYLYQLLGMNIGEFLLYMLPYTVASGLLLLIAVWVFSAGKQKISLKNCDFGGEAGALEPKKNAVYLALFFLCLFAVAGLIPYYLALAAVLFAVAVMDREVLKRVDYCLLLTFIAFFIFTGNVSRLPAFRAALEELVGGREILVGVLASQCISNVPAALLLSGFTQAYRELLLGVNIGGLGTLIASMASLISYKSYARQYNNTKGKYLLWFTAANLVFLAMLSLLAGIRTM